MLDLKRDKKGRVVDISHFRTMFKNEIGKPDRYIEVNKEILYEYKELLPNELLHYWNEYGFSSFLDGLFWLTNPNEYKKLVEYFLKGTPYEKKGDIYVIARTAFGRLYLWEKSKGDTLSIFPLLNMIFLNADADRENLTIEEENYAMNRFLALDPDYLDEDDINDKPLFSRALKKFGKLETNEMYGYKLSHFLGGKENITNLNKVDLFVHTEIQKQLKEPVISISDIEDGTVTY